MATEVERIQYDIRVEGQQQAATAFEGTARSIKKSDDALKGASNSAKLLPAAFSSATRAVNDNAKAFEQVAIKAKTLSSVTGRLGAEMVSLGGSALQMGASVGKAGTAFHGMSRIVGGVGTGAAAGGLAGAAAGGLIAILSELVNWLGQTKTLEEQLAESTAKANAEFEKQYDSTEKIVQRMRDADARRRNEDLRRKLTFPDLAAQVTGTPTDASRQQTLAADLESLNALEKQRELDIDIREKVSPTKRPDLEWIARQKRDKDIAGWQAQMQHLDRLSDEPTLDQRAEAGKVHILRKEAEIAAFKVEQEQFEERMQMFDETEKRFEDLSKVGKEAFSSIGKTAVGLFSQIAQGQKITAKDILMTLGSELVAKGTIWLFDGDARVAESYGLDPSGYTLNAIGGAAVAAGIAMMAGSTAAGRSGGGGGGGGLSRPRSSATDPYWRPDQMGGRSQAPIVVNQHNLLGDAQAGLAAVRAIQEAQRQGLVTNTGVSS